MTEPDVSDLLTVAQAIAIIDAAPVHPRIIELPLDESDGLIVAQDILSDRDYPPFDKSLMDGYAVRISDVATTPIELNIIGEIPAGQSAARGLAHRETLAIMTGAPIPEGADGVIPIEDTEKTGSAVRILRATSPSRYIAKRGADIRASATVLKSGSTLNPAALAVAASVGAARIQVFAKPKVALLSTGDELVPIDQTPGPAQIRNSNSLMLAALLKRMGCDVTDLGIVPDTPQATRDALLSGMSYDVLFVTGGMSMGQYDYVPRTLLDLGANLKITKLRIKPGKPFVFAARDSRYIFGLPGNPLAGFVCTVRLASRLLARLSGAQPREKWIEGHLAEPLPQNGPREFYQPARFDGGAIHPLAWKGSADIFTLANATGLLIRAENEPPHPAGNRVRMLEF